MSTTITPQRPLAFSSDSLLRPLSAIIASVRSLIGTLFAFDDKDLKKLYRLATCDSVNPELLAELDALAAAPDWARHPSATRAASLPR